MITCFTSPKHNTRRWKFGVVALRHIGLRLGAEMGHGIGSGGHECNSMLQMIVEHYLKILPFAH